MIREEQVYRIGRLGKSHGVRGELTMMVGDDVFDRVGADFLVLRVDGILVPFFMEEYRFKTDTTLIVKFEGVDSQERARELTNCDVFFPRRLADDDTDDYSWTYFVGFDVVEADTQTVVGRIAAVDESTVNVLFCLEDGRLIPASDDLVVKVDHARRQVLMNLPEGLLTL